MRLPILWLALATLIDPAVRAAGAKGRETPPPWTGDAWRQERRVIDLHEHIGGTEEHLRRAVRILDRAGVGVGVNLSGGTVTAKPGETSEFVRNQA